MDFDVKVSRIVANARFFRRSLCIREVSFGLTWFVTLKCKQHNFIRTVLKHGPRSLTYVPVLWLNLLAQWKWLLGYLLTWVRIWIVREFESGTNLNLVRFWIRHEFESNRIWIWREFEFGANWSFELFMNGPKLVFLCEWVWHDFDLAQIGRQGWWFRIIHRQNGFLIFGEARIHLSLCGQFKNDNFCARIIFWVCSRRLLRTTRGFGDANLNVARIEVLSYSWMIWIDFFVWMNLFLHEFELRPDFMQFESCSNLSFAWIWIIHEWPQFHLDANLSCARI